MENKNYMHRITVEITECEEKDNPYIVTADNLKFLKSGLTDIRESGILGYRNRSHIQNAIERIEKVEKTFEDYAADTLEAQQRKAVKSKIGDATPEQLEKIAAILG
jgi:uncharacterized protein YbcV (DUF1398 family)